MFEVSYFDRNEKKCEFHYETIVEAVRCFRDAVWDGMYCVRLLYLEDDAV